tara:strand:- start:315 stop:512 length:198 start_codon:yes stop_codon:yes gene_type:complete
MNSHKKLELEILKKDKQISELYVLIDTLQTNIRSAVAYLDEKEMDAVNNHSFKWSTGWKPGDEKK